MMLPAKCTKYLLTKPEDGMGFQKVKIVFTDGTVLHDCVVFNATEADVPVACASKKIYSVVKK